MSRKKSQRPNQPPSQPRAMADINTEYNGICSQLGEARYQEEAAKNRGFTLMRRIHELGVEADLRRKLDALKAPPNAAQVALPAAPAETVQPAAPQATEQAPAEAPAPEVTPNV